MKENLRFTFAATLVAAVSPALVVAQADSTAQATPVAGCELRLAVKLKPDVPDPRDAGFVSSLLGNHPHYRVTLQRQDHAADSSVIALDLTGPGPEAGCREVVNSMREDRRVLAVEVQANATDTTPAGDARPASAAQPMGTAYPGPDGDWILEPLNGVSYAQQARDRYECDILAVNQTGFDPMQDDGGVPLVAVPGKRADYLRAEGACFQSRGYLLR